jgi:hypothetical protein
MDLLLISLLLLCRDGIKVDKRHRRRGDRSYSGLNCRIQLFKDPSKRGNPAVSSFLCGVVTEGSMGRPYVEQQQSELKDDHVALLFMKLLN